MGKSPGKWIKTLFGKKSSKSQSLKKYGSEKEQNDGKASLDPGSPVISQPIPAVDSGNGVQLESGITPELSLPTGQVDLLYVNGDDGRQGNAVVNCSDDVQRTKLEKAAIKAQAAFRGYLARRAFRALRGIIRLQAVMRGHLVRRQAVATFQCIVGIVKLQALVRGRQVKFSSKADSKCYQDVSVAATLLDASTVRISSLKMKFSDHVFIFKLLSSTRVATPLQLQYVDGEPNEVWNWLERWTLNRFWKPVGKPKRAGNLKPHGKHSSFIIETESGRPKRSVRRNFSSHTEHGSVNAIADSERAKRNSRKNLNSPSDATQGSPQNEFEKVKRNLRKMSSAANTSGQEDEVAEKPKLISRRAPNPCTDEKKEEEEAEKEAAELFLPAEVKALLENMPNSGQDEEPSLAADSKSMKANGSADDHNLAPDSLPLQGIVLDENRSLLDEDMLPKEDKCHENQKPSRRRASFSSKSDYPENTLQEIPKLPSYMAATKSAKAKLRGQVSPRLSSETVDKNAITRRHSLPSSTNGKLTSQSPRVQKVIQGSGGKVGIKSERSFPSSKDDKPIQVEWRR